MSPDSIIPLLEKAIQARTDLFDSEYASAFRLFNGFTEGYSDLVLEIYGRTLVIHNYAHDPDKNQILVQDVIEYLRNHLNWLHAGIIKTRNGKTQTAKKGVLVFGEKSDTAIKEHGVHYAIDLTMNRDTSFYLDTRNLRKWFIDNIQGK